MTQTEKETLRKALLNHDGRTLAPDWKHEDQDRLTRLLDELRVSLMPR